MMAACGFALSVGLGQGSIAGMARQENSHFIFGTGATI
jgi:hypothetical protein